MTQAPRTAPPAGTALGLPPDGLEPDPAYREALAWIWSFSEAGQSGRPDSPDRGVKLARTRAMLERLGQPHRAYAAILVAGSKGKGSTAAMLSACLLAAGHRTGRYTSPHLVNWRERTWIDGRPIEAEEVVDLLPLVREAVASLPDGFGSPTTFEVGTALTLLAFARRRVQVAVVEVGVGGLYDATNVVDPLVSVITPISVDHVATLGPTLAAIAHHKAGVLRPGRPAVVGPQPAEALEVLRSEASRLGAQVAEVGRDWRWRALPSPGRGGCSGAWGGERPDAGPSFVVESTGSPRLAFEVELPLRGAHQRDNATAAVAALVALGREKPDLAVASGDVRVGLERVDWPGRLQVLRRRPLVVLDGAHNAASARALQAALGSELCYRGLHLVLGLTAGKDAAGVLSVLAAGARTVYLTRSRHERAVDPQDLLTLTRSLDPHARAATFPDLPSALRSALSAAAEDDLVLVAGSLFLVGEALAADVG